MSQKQVNINRISSVSKPFSRRSTIYLIAILFLVVILSSSCTDSGNEQPMNAQNGILDLQNWGLDQQGVVPLRGEWEYYWQKLLTPQIFNGLEEQTNTYVKVPSSWENAIINGTEIDSHGYATYRLTINRNPSSVQRTTPTLLALKIPPIATAYRLWINDQFMTQVGVVGESHEQMKAAYWPQVIPFYVSESSIEIVIQISNFTHHKAGIWTDIKFGTYSQIMSLKDTHYGIQKFLISCLLIIAFYHIANFLFRKKDLSHLFFGLACIAVGIRNLFIGEMPIVLLLPNLSWEMMIRIEYLTFFLGVPAFIFFFYYLFPKEVSKGVAWILLLWGCVLSLFIFAVPLHLSIYSVFVQQLVMILTILYLFICIWFAVKRKREGSWIILLSSVIYGSTIINDLLHYNQILMLTPLAPYGLVIFAMIHSLYLSLKLSKDFQHAEHTLELQNAELYQLEKNRRTFFANISHDLKTPITTIQGYVESLIDGIVERGEEKKYLNVIRAKVIELDYLIQDLFELSKLDDGQISFQSTLVEMDKLLINFVNMNHLDVKHAGLQLHLVMPDFSQNELPFPVIDADPHKLQQALLNLVTNAIKYSGEGTQLILRLEVTSDRIDVLVEDTGSGVTDEELKYLFDRFYRGNQIRHSSQTGSGIGLAIVKEMIEAQGGSIQADHGQQQGLIFRISFPIVQIDDPFTM